MTYKVHKPNCIKYVKQFPALLTLFLILVPLYAISLEVVYAQSGSDPAKIRIEIYDDVDKDGDISSLDRFYYKTLVIVQGVDDFGNPLQYGDQSSLNPLDYDSRIGVIVGLTDTHPNKGFDSQGILNLASGYEYLSNLASCSKCINGTHGLGAGDEGTIRLLVGESRTKKLIPFRIYVYEDNDHNGRISSNDPYYDEFPPIGVKVRITDGISGKVLQEDIVYYDNDGIDSIPLQGIIGRIYELSPNISQVHISYTDLDTYLASGWKDISTYPECAPSANGTGSYCVSGSDGIETEIGIIRLLVQESSQEITSSVSLTTTSSITTTNQGFYCIFVNKEPPLEVGDRLRLFVAVSRNQVPDIPAGFSRALQCDDLAIYPQMRIRVFGANVQNDATLLQYTNTTSTEFVGWEVQLLLESVPEDFVIQLAHSDVAPWEDIQLTQPLEVEETFISRYGKEGLGAVIGALVTLVVGLLTLGVPFLARRRTSSEE